MSDGVWDFKTGVYGAKYWERAYKTGDRVGEVYEPSADSNIEYVDGYVYDKNDSVMAHVHARISAEACRNVIDILARY